jgi:hypothetical protein
MVGVAAGGVAAGAVVGLGLAAGGVGTGAVAAAAEADWPAVAAARADSRRAGLPVGLPAGLAETDADGAGVGTVTGGCAAAAAAAWSADLANAPASPHIPSRLSSAVRHVIRESRRSPKSRTAPWLRCLMPQAQQLAG